MTSGFLFEDQKIRPNLKIKNQCIPHVGESNIVGNNITIWLYYYQ